MEFQLKGERAHDQKSIECVMEDKMRGYRDSLESAKILVCHRICKQQVNPSAKQTGERESEKRTLPTPDLPDQKRQKDGYFAGLRLKTPSAVKKPIFDWRELQSLRDPALTGK